MLISPFRTSGWLHPQAVVNCYLPTYINEIWLSIQLSHKTVSYAIYFISRLINIGNILLPNSLPRVRFQSLRCVDKYLWKVFLKNWKSLSLNSFACCSLANKRFLMIIGFHPSFNSLDRYAICRQKIRALIIFF